MERISKVITSIIHTLLGLLFNKDGRTKEKTLIVPNDIIRDTIIKFERGYANHHLDSGGETYNGISRNNFPNWMGWKIIDELRGSKPLNTKAKRVAFEKILNGHQFLNKAVEGFYHEEFWNKMMLFKLDYEPLQREMFDTGINAGKSRAIKMLQEALNVMNLNEKIYPDLVIDGKIGSKTINAFKKILKRNDTDIFMKAMNGEQYIHYKGIVNRNPTQEIFFRSWLRRVDF